MALRLRIDGAASEPISRSTERAAVTDQLNTDSTITPVSRSAGKREVDSINENIADTAVQAAAAVLELREQEVSLLEESKNRAYGDGTILRQNQASSIESEISRITSNATYNGVDALVGRLLTLDENSSNLHEAIGLASFAGAATTSARFSDQTPSNAEADLEVVKDALVSISSLLTSYESASQKAKDSGTPKEISFDTAVPTSLRDTDQARELARKIAATVVTPYATERQKASLIEMSASALSESKVYSLIA